MRVPLIPFVVVACGLGACFPPALVEPDARARLAFDPGDGATAQAARGLTVAIDDPGHLLDEAALAGLAGHLWLKTWPEAAKIAIATEPAPGLFEFQKLIRVMPADLLEDRWYELGIDDLPPRVVPAAVEPDGTVAARFRPGTHPRVAKLTLCGATDDAMSLVVAFSELVTCAAAPADVVGLAVDRHPARCSWAGGDGGVYSFTCEDVPRAASVTVSIGPGIAGVTGVALEPAKWEVPLPNLPVGTCSAFLPPI